MLQPVNGSKKKGCSDAAAGFGNILTDHLQLCNGSPDVVLRPSLHQLSDRAGASYDDNRCSYRFLRSCHLCHKPMSLHQSVYMYRGEVGFCSVECRNRQIYLDEMKKIEIYTRRILASFHRHRRGGGGRCGPGRRTWEEFPAVAPPPIFFSMESKVCALPFFRSWNGTVNSELMVTIRPTYFGL